MIAQLLAHRLALYVPSKDHANKDLPANKRAGLLTHAIFGLAKACGGATTQQAQGAWVYGDGTVGTEDVTIVYAHVSEAGFREATRTLHSLAHDIMRDGSQASVLVEVDGQARLLTQDETAV